MSTVKRGFFMNASKGDAAEMMMFGPIGGNFWDDGITAVAVADALRGLDKSVKTLTIQMDSPGGVISEGMAIYNLLTQSGLRIEMNVVGWAASAASVILMAADKRAVAENGMVMVHEGWSVTIGNKGDHTKTAELLDKLDSQIRATYVRRTGKSAAQVQSWVEAETWFTGTEAVDAGFADEVIPLKGEQNSFDREIVAKFAAQYRRGSEMLNRFMGSAPGVPLAAEVDLLSERVNNAAALVDIDEEFRRRKLELLKMKTA